MGSITNSGLKQGSPLYGDMASIYERFARAEDMDRHVSRFLERVVRGKSVLDAGCGTGKYISELALLTDSYAGIDAAREVLQFAREKSRAFPHAAVFHARAESLPFPSESFDCAFACWVLGTIVDDTAQKEAFSEICRVVKREGSIYLIENDLCGDFEYIRGRFPDTSRTERYNRWLESNGAKVAARFTSHFEFRSIEEAASIMGAIWGPEAAAKVKSARIGHKIVIYRACPLL